MGALAGLVAFGVLGAALWALERRFGARPLAPRGLRATGTDLLYVLTHRITSFVADVAATVAMALFALTHGWRGMTFEVWFAARTALFAGLPRWAQIVGVLVVVDFLGYWTHRLEHQGALWRLHAVHHSPRHLDWLAASRNHPLSVVLQRALLAVLLLFLGVDARIAAGVFPLIGVWSILLHANVPWRFGPLRYVVATPLFHRWHHARAPEAHDRNFGGLFPLWDILFGTFHCPGRQPQGFGADLPVPDGFLAQLAFPFRPGPPDAPSAAKMQPR